MFSCSCPVVGATGTIKKIYIHTGFVENALSGFLVGAGGMIYIARIFQSDAVVSSLIEMASALQFMMLHSVQMDHKFWLQSALASLFMMQLTGMFYNH